LIRLSYASLEQLKIQNASYDDDMMMMMMMMLAQSTIFLSNNHFNLLADERIEGSIP